jgi:hypothetical protein
MRLTIRGLKRYFALLLVPEVLGRALIVLGCLLEYCGY